MYRYLVALLGISFLFGCAGNPTAEAGVEMANESLHKEKSPLRADIKIFEDGGAVISKVWAGEEGSSIMEFADETLKQDVWKLFKNKCGFNESDRKEVRVVEHKPPFFYEVWVFNDARSGRDDGTSGISLILRVPSTGGTDMELVGVCPA